MLILVLVIGALISTIYIAITVSHLDAESIDLCLRAEYGDLINSFHLLYNIENVHVNN